MKDYMLAQLKLRYGPTTLARYDNVMVKVRSFFEGGGVMLRHGMITRVGPLYEALNLWQIDDQGHVARVFEAARNRGFSDEEKSMMATLEEIVLEESVRFLEDLPFIGRSDHAG